MVHIKKGKKRLIVTNGAYKEYYKTEGWVIDGQEVEAEFDAAEEYAPGGKEDSAEDNEEPDENEEAEEEGLEGSTDEIKELLGKPVSEMTNKELKKVVAELELDVRGKSKEDVKKIVAKALSKRD